MAVYLEIIVSYVLVKSRKFVGVFVAQSSPWISVSFGPNPL